MKLLIILMVVMLSGCICHENIIGSNFSAYIQDHVKKFDLPLDWEIRTSENYVALIYLYEYHESKFMHIENGCELSTTYH